MAGALFTYFPICVSVSDGEDQPHTVFQILDFEKTLKAVKTFDSDKLPGVSWMLQIFEVWGNGHVAHGAREVFVFPLVSPAMTNILSISGKAPHDRSKFRVWTRCPSDLEGAHCLREPSQLKPSVSLTSSQIPVLCLVDACATEGIIPRPGKVVHTRRTKIYDSRHLRRLYLQAVLASSWLFRSGVVEFPSERPMAFYLMLLRKPSEAAALLAATRAELEEKLQKHQKETWGGGRRAWCL